MHARWDREADAAYISPIPAEEREQGITRTSVPLDAETLEPVVPAVNRLILDFDSDGRLIGIEVLGQPETVLRDSSLSER